MSSSVRVIAFDPGYDRLGVAVLDREGGKESLVYSACLTTEKSDAFTERLSSLGAEVRALLKDYAPDIVALERLYITKNQKTAMAVAEVRGMLIFLAAEQGAALVEYTPPEIKLAVTGDGRADKKQVIAMVPKLVAVEKEIRYDDEFDAIAVGLTALACHRPG